MSYHNYFVSACIGFFLVSCQEFSEDAKKLELLKASETGVVFRNTIDENAVNVFDYVNMYNGAGVAVADFNKDGFEDLFFAGNLVSSRLYLNNGKIEPFSFLDKTAEAGVETNCWVNGVTIVDIDQNGWDDIYCSVSGGKSGEDRANLLFLNSGVDENGSLHFEEKATQYHLNDTTHTIQSAFFDYDGDDDLDVFMMVNHPTGYLDSEANRIKIIEKIGDPEHTDRLYRNDGNDESGNIVFTDVSQEAGITLEGFGLGLALTDFNEDGKPDIYVANDYVTNDILYVNNGDGTFTDRIRELVNHTSFSSMGIDVADINNDGFQDFMVLDMLPENDDEVKMMYPASNHISFNMRKNIGYLDQYYRNTLQLNNGIDDSITRKFSEIGQFSNVFSTNWSWSVLMPDLDLDGWRDIFITNGFLKNVNDLDFVNYDTQNPFGQQKKRDDKAYLESLKTHGGIHIPNYLFQNQGNLTFENRSREWGFDIPSFSNGATYADFDNDGDLDLVTNNLNEAAFIIKNNTISSDKQENNYLQIDLVGEKPNTRAVGAKISFETSKGILSHVNYKTRGFMSSVSPIANFGLGQDSLINHIAITWPDGSTQSVFDVKANQRITINKNPNSKNTGDSYTTTKKLFEPVSINGLNYVHNEIPFNDFDYQTLIPHKLSKLGPSLAVGDIDGDKFDDFYVGAAKGKVGSMFYQDKNGSFTSEQIENTTLHEDQGSLLLDIDSDGDLDLYIVSGGVEYGKESRYYSDRLIINTGNRTFKRASLEFPRENGSCAIAADYDKDGDLDIFVGGASRPEAYPLPAESMLLENNTTVTDEPVLTNLADTTLPELKTLGIVRGAIWSDYDNDGWLDLLVVGEFMPVTIFKNNRGLLQKIDVSPFPSEKGMWNSINGHDFDQDGDIDYILGNYGLNSKYSPTIEEPIKIYAKDFDSNGIIDPIMTYFDKKREVPVHLRDDLYKQLIVLKKNLPTYRKYAEASITSILPKEVLNGAEIFEWNYSYSSVLKNNGSKGFELIPLPNRAQISPIYGTFIQDFDGDTIPDILAVGNSHSQDSFSGWQDASLGTLLIGNGDGTFEVCNYDKSGFYVDGDAKALASLKLYDDTFINLVSVNSDSLKLFKASEQKAGKILEMEPFENRLKIQYKNGKTEMREFYYGSGYLSQNTRSFLVSEKIKSVTMFNNEGAGRTILIQPNPNFP